MAWKIRTPVLSRAALFAGLLRGLCAILCVVGVLEIGRLGIRRYHLHSSVLTYSLIRIVLGPSPRELHKLMSVNLPRTIRIDETAVAQILLVGSIRNPIPKERATAYLQSPAFDITTPPDLLQFDESRNVVEWRWLLTPKHTGKHKISFQLTDDFAFPVNPDMQLQVDGSEREFVLNLIDRRSRNIEGNGIVFDVEVVDELGLTSREKSILAVIGTLLGLLATISGYPFFKRYFEKKSAKNE